MEMLSIIVPVYNVKEYLMECLDSLDAQTYEDLEILLIDDGSTDGSGEMAEQYAGANPRFRFIRRENGGLSAARNTGVQHASGEWILFVDSDDVVAPEFAEKMLSLVKETGADLGVCGYDCLHDGKTEAVPLSFEKGVITPELYLDALVREQIPSFSCCRIFPRKLLQRIPFLEGHVFEDIYLSNAIQPELRNVALLPEALYHYRLRPGSITMTMSLTNYRDYYYALKERKELSLLSEAQKDVLTGKLMVAVLYLYEAADGESEKISSAIEEIKSLSKEERKRGYDTLSRKYRGMILLWRCFPGLYLTLIRRHRGKM